MVSCSHKASRLVPLVGRYFGWYDSFGRNQHFWFHSLHRTGYGNLIPFVETGTLIFYTFNLIPFVETGTLIFYTFNLIPFVETGTVIFYTFNLIPFVETGTLIFCTFGRYKIVESFLWWKRISCVWKATAGTYTSKQCVVCAEKTESEEPQKPSDSEAQEEGAGKKYFMSTDTISLLDSSQLCRTPVLKLHHTLCIVLHAVS